MTLWGRFEKKRKIIRFQFVEPENLWKIWWVFKGCGKWYSFWLLGTIENIKKSSWNNILCEKFEHTEKLVYKFDTKCVNLNGTSIQISLYFS